MDVVVSQGWGRIAYNIVRSLGRRGLKVCVGTDRFRGMAYYSRYPKARFRHPSYVEHPESFVAGLRDILVRYSPKVYLPSDEEAFVVARHIDMFKDLDVAIPIAPYETLKQLHMKNESYDIALSLGIPAPLSLVPKNADDDERIFNSIKERVVVKRLSSASARGTYVFDKLSKESFRKWIDGLGLQHGEYLVQQHVRGIGYGVSMLYNHGKLKARFTHKRLKEIAPCGGVSTQRVSAASKHLEEYAESMLNKVNYHGVAMIEFIHDEMSGQSWFIEVNPRFWGSVALAIQSGVDFPYLLYKMAVNGDVEPVESYRLGTKVTWILGDFMRAAKGFNRNRYPDPPPSDSGRASGYDDFYWDDPVPFFAELLLSLIKHGRGRRSTHADAILNVGNL